MKKIITGKDAFSVRGPEAGAEEEHRYKAGDIVLARIRSRRSPLVPLPTSSPEYYLPYYVLPVKIARRIHQNDVGIGGNDYAPLAVHLNKSLRALFVHVTSVRLMYNRKSLSELVIDFFHFSKSFGDFSPVPF